MMPFNNDTKHTQNNLACDVIKKINNVHMKLDNS
jgi:hypothetical protein